jgi:hypothetical protein
MVGMDDVVLHAEWDELGVRQEAVLEVVVLVGEVTPCLDAELLPGWCVLEGDARSRSRRES